MTLGGAFNSEFAANSIITETALRVGWVSLQETLAATPALGDEPWLNSHVCIHGGYGFLFGYLFGPFCLPFF